MIWDEANTFELRRLWAEGLSAAEIARRLGCGKGAVVSKAKRAGCEPRPSPITEDTWEWDDTRQLIDFWADGISTSEIARRLGRTKDAVIGKAHRIGCEKRPSPLGRGGVQPPPRLYTPERDEMLCAQVLSGRLLTDIVEALNRLPGPTLVATQVMRRLKDLRHKRKLPPVRQLVVKQRPAPAPALAHTEPPKPVGHATDAPVAPRRAYDVVTLMTPPRSCQWPHGTPGTKGFHFCGARAIPAKPYCEEHYAIAYIQVKTREAA